MNHRSLSTSIQKVVWVAWLLLTDTTSIVQAGCSGTPKSCSVQSTSTTCSRVYGCSWRGSWPNQSCSGSASPCSSMTGSSSCRDQGCTWTSGGGAPPAEGCCAGQVLSCSEIAYNLCSRHAGCEQDGDNSSGDCIGKAHKCSSMTTSSTCSKQGCAWIPAGESEALQGKCTGTRSNRCSKHTRGQTCISESGCKWDRDSRSCVGTPYPCKSMSTFEGRCKIQDGCRWEWETVTCSSSSSSEKGLSGGGIFGVILLVCFVLGATAWYFLVYRKKAPRVESSKNMAEGKEVEMKATKEPTALAVDTETGARNAEFATPPVIDTGDSQKTGKIKTKIQVVRKTVCHPDGSKTVTMEERKL